MVLTKDDATFTMFAPARRGELASTTLADCVFAVGFHGFSFGNKGSAETAAEG